MSIELGPYSNFHKLNQDWFLNEFNKTLDQWKSMQKNFDNLQDAFNDLKTYMNEYFKNLNIQEEVNNWLDSALSEGKLQLSPYRYNIMNENGDAIEDKILSAINKGYNYLYVPSGEYNLIDKTIEITKFVDILFSKSAIVHPLIKNGVHNTFIKASSDFVLTGGKFISTAHTPSYGTSKIQSFIVGNNSNISFNDVTFDTFQPYNFTAAEKQFNLRTATIVTCYDCSLTFKNCEFYNIKNYEFINQFVINKNIKDLFTVFDSCKFNNTDHSINLRSGYCNITNCSAYSDYNGSLFNAYCSVINAVNNKMNILDENSFIDTAEGGLYNSDYVHFNNNDCSIIVFSIKSDIESTAKVIYECKIKIDVDFDPKTYRTQPTQLDAHFSDCHNISFVQIDVPESTLDVTFVACTINNNTPNSNSNGTVKFLGCNINPKNNITGNKQMNYIGCTIDGNINVFGITKPVLFSGCVAKKGITLYKISDTNDEYIVNGCYNINIPI